MFLCRPVFLLATLALVASARAMFVGNEIKYAIDSLLRGEQTEQQQQQQQKEPEHPKVKRRSDGPFRRMFPEFGKPLPIDKNIVGDPLFLTPYIREKNVSLARQLAKVTGAPAQVAETYSGYITVNETCDSNLFFWYIPATFKNVSPMEPMVIWLQGGPGGSSLFGLFVEHGPFSVDAKMKLVKRDTAWTLMNNVIYVDQPVGTGFSFTKKDECYARTEDDVAKDLYEFVRQFMLLFPEMAKNPWYVTGESYAGKYVPALAYKIHEENQKAKSKSDIVPLKGIAIGDGLCDPVSMTNYGDFLFNIGLIDEGERSIFQKYAKEVIEKINAKQYTAAFQAFDELLNGDLSGHTSYFTNTTGFHYYFNYLMTESPKEFGYHEKFLQMNETRKAIHVGAMPYNDGKKVEMHLINDVMQSVKPRIEALLNANYRVMIYNGQLDVIIAWTLTENFVNSLQWSGAEKFKNAQRLKWTVDTDLAGYVKESGNFVQVLVRNAGHMVPFDQPKWAWDLIQRFVQAKKFA